jgi:hypothetical protein
MSRPAAKRSRSKSQARLEAVTAAIAPLVPKCIATIVELANGPLLLMACPATAGCSRCDDARRRQRPRDVGAAPKPMPAGDAAISPEDE